MLWVDKHRPLKVDDLSYHSEVSARLRALSSNPATMPHLFFYGPSGSGKKTRIATLLRELYGPGVEKLKLDKRTFTTPTKRAVEVNLVTSNYHIELSPGDAGLNDRFVVQEVVKEMASSKNIVSAASMPGVVSQNPVSPTKSAERADFKIVVLMDCDKLSRQAQAALRRTMEKYSTSCRLILCCNCQSKVIEPVRSRCLGIRVAAPSPNEIMTVLKHISTREAISLPDELAFRIANESSRNLRRAILMMEACHVQKRDGLSVDQPVQKADWELYIATLAVEITREQTPQRLSASREKLYELLVNCIPADIILKTLANELLKNLDDGLKQEVIEWAAFYEYRISQGRKEIFHLEAFVAKYMSIYKRYLNDLFG